MLRRERDQRLYRYYMRAHRKAVTVEGAAGLLHQTYPLRRACQWELTAAFLAAQAEGDPRRRVLVVSPEQKADHIHPIELLDAKFRTAPTDDRPALHELVQSIVKHVAVLDGPLAGIHPLSAPL